MGRINSSRYAYKIDTSVTYTSQSGKSHKINVKFIGTEITSKNVESRGGKDYIVHPAFTFDGKALSGFTPVPESKYYDLYTSTSADSTNIGDALYETKGWNYDYAVFINHDNPVFARGGYNSISNRAGIFFFNLHSVASLGTKCHEKL